MILNTNKLKILKEFSTDYNKRIYGRDVAKKLEMNQKTVSNILNEFEKEHILKFAQEGKNKYYFFNKFNPNIKEVVKLIEIGKKIEFIEKNSKFKELFNKLEERTEGMLIVFGSYANCTNHKNSDLDIFVTEKINDVEDLEELYDVKINIVKSNKNKLKEKEYIIKEVIKNHIILKGIEDFVELIWLV